MLWPGQTRVTSSISTNVFEHFYLKYKKIKGVSLARKTHPVSPSNHDILLPVFGSTSVIRIQFLNFSVSCRHRVYGHQYLHTHTHWKHFDGLPFNFFVRLSIMDVHTFQYTNRVENTRDSRLIDPFFLLIFCSENIFNKMLVTLFENKL